VCHDFKQESPFLVITTQHASIFCLSPGLQHNRSTQFTTNFWSELDAVYGTWTDSNRARPPRLAYSVLCSDLLLLLCGPRHTMSPASDELLSPPYHGAAARASDVMVQCQISPVSMTAINVRMSACVSK
jgi:hypothetical protein